MATRSRSLLALIVLIALIVSACNLSGAPSEEQIAQTNTALLASQPPTRTPASTSGVPTTFPVSQPTAISFPTSIVVVPTSAAPPVFPSNTPLPVSIVILSPVPGNIVAGNVQVLGSASHPQFLQYQLEYGPDNTSDLWFPITSVGAPIINGLLGIWNTTSVQDSAYRLRLRVYLRDGTLLTTVINNIRVQNRVNTPVPSATPNIPRPISAFTQNVVSGDVPLTVQFTNQSSGTINTLLWSFGDGTTSSEPNPSHIFTSPGLYNVSLTVTGPGGTSNVARQINATSPSAPVAGFTQDRTSGVAPLEVQFTNQSTGRITSYLWIFSDGTSTTEVNPKHNFAVPGTYNVLLTVTGPGGSSSVIRQITVTSAIPPTATPSPTFTWTFTPTSTSIPPTATFTPTATSIPPTATFTTTVVPPTATFTATLIPPTATFTNTSVPPTATFTPSATPTTAPTDVPPPQALFVANVTPSNPLAVQFADQSTGQIVAYAWDFGDGQTSNEQNPLHTYATGGTYTVTLTVTDALGRTSPYTANVTVVEPAQALFTYTINSVNVQFTNQSTGQIVAYAWDFGDGQTSNEQNPLHTYAAGGTYTASLTVTGADGGTDTHSESITVSEPVVAGFTSAVNGLSVQFTSTSTGSIAQYGWDFGDGQTSNEQNPLHTYAIGGTYTVSLIVLGSDGSSNSHSEQITVAEPVVAGFTSAVNGLSVQFTSTSTGSITQYGWDFGDGQTSNEQNPLHAYAIGGTYTVILTVTGSDGSSNSHSEQVTVTEPVQAGFTAAINGLSVQFTSTSTGSITQYAWDFGDGQISNEQNPLHAYAADGTYTVALIVFGGDGSTNSHSEQITISSPVQANFTATANGLDVQFTDASTGTISMHTWDFGDGQISNEQNPLHTYATEGTYNVSLTVVDPNGASAKYSTDVVVTAPQSTPTLVDTTPILPDFNTLSSLLRAIYQNGASIGNRAGVFAVAGDSIFTRPRILAPFAPSGEYTLNGNEDLQPIIDWFNLIDLGGTTSFDQTSTAVNGDWMAQDLLDPNQSDASVCTSGETPLACELRLKQPVLMFVSIGVNDAQNGTDPSTFRTTLRQIVDAIAANGTIPVLLTIPDDGSNPATLAINEQIIAVAQEAGIPPLNVARAVAELPSFNMDFAPSGPGDMSNDAVSNYGINAVNYNLLRVLNDARNIIFPDAP